MQAIAAKRRSAIILTRESGSNKGIWRFDGGVLVYGLAGRTGIPGHQEFSGEARVHLTSRVELLW